MEYLSKNLGLYNLHMIKNDNFKQTIVRVTFRGKENKDEITIRNFLESMIVYSSKKYNTRRKMLLKEEELYSAIIYSDSNRIGNFYETSFGLISLDDKYTEKGNFEKALEFFIDMIKHPNVSDGKFDSKSFNIIMNKVVLYLTSKKEDKDSYSIERLYEEMGKDSPISYRDGYIEDLNSITRESLFNYYKKFVEESDIDIYVVGAIDFEVIDPMIRKYFKPNTYRKRKDGFIIEHKKRRLKKIKVIEHDNIAQSKLNLGFKMYNMSIREKEYPLVLYNIILGGGSDSKLFKEVREEKSLCYYIYSVCNDYDNTMRISAGISKDSFNECLKIINKDVKDMEKGLFTDEDLEKAKEIYISYLNNIYDSEENIINMYSTIGLLGTDDIETRKKKIKTVTKDDIISVAKKISLDTIYLLEGVK